MGRHNQIEHILTGDGIQVYLMSDRSGQLTVSKQTTHRVHMERFDLKKLNGVEGKEQYRVEISNRFTAW
jgi:hypothetical protein